LNPYAEGRRASFVGQRTRSRFVLGTRRFFVRRGVAAREREMHALAGKRKAERFDENSIWTSVRLSKEIVELRSEEWQFGALKGALDIYPTIESEHG
jgi:hypothetical protein